MLSKIDGLVTLCFKGFANDLVTEFKLDQQQVSKFVDQWLQENVGKVARASKARTKDPNAPNKMTGYLLFCKEQRDVLDKNEAKLSKEKKTSATEKMKKFGVAWSKLSDAQKKKWNEKAAKMNEENGIVMGKGSKATNAKTASKPNKGKKAKAEEEEEEFEDAEKEEDEEKDGYVILPHWNVIDEWFGKDGKTLSELKELAKSYNIEFKSNIGKPALKKLFYALLN